MSLRRTLFLIAAIIALLLPLGQLIRHHTPWTCFAMTWDESFFAQAALNWSEGRGYRMNWDAKPFSPAITVGVPMAWGASAIANWTGSDIALSGRIFVYFAYVLACLILMRATLVSQKNWLAVPLALWFFGYGVSAFPQGDYFVFGFLGEGLGLFFGALTYHSIVRQRFFLSGVFAAAAFGMKPTFLMLAPAVPIAAASRSKAAAFKSGMGTLLGIGSIFVLIAQAREQEVLQYLKEYYQFASIVSVGLPLHRFFSDAGSITTFFCAAFVGIGGYLFIRRKRFPRVLPSHVAFLFFTLNLLNAILTGKGVVLKQWSAICCMTLMGFSIDWSNIVANRFKGWLSSERVREVSLAVIFTWVLTIGFDARHRFKRQADRGCPSKEQSVVNRELRQLKRYGKVTPQNLLVVSHDHPAANFVYSLGWSPTELENWKALPHPIPEWVAGQIRPDDPIPRECRPHFSGEQFSLFRCNKVANGVRSRARR